MTAGSSSLSLDRILGELASALGVDELSADENNLAGLNFSGMDVLLFWVAEENAFLFCSTLDEMQKHEVPLAQLYEKLLTMNHLMVGQSHACLGLADGNITLSLYCPVEEPFSVQQVGEPLLAFVGDALEMEETLVKWAADTESREVAGGSTHREDVDPTALA